MYISQVANITFYVYLRTNFPVKFELRVFNVKQACHKYCIVKKYFIPCSSVDAYWVGGCVGRGGNRYVFLS